MTRPVSNPEDRLPMPPDEDEPTTTLDNEWDRLTPNGTVRWQKGMTARNDWDSGVVTNVWFDGCPIGAPVSVWVQCDEELPAVDILAPGAASWWPAWNDDATKGCLLGQARRAWKDEHLHVSYVRPGSNPHPASPYHPCWMAWYHVPYGGQRRVGRGETEAEALIAAIEAAAKEAP